MNMDIDEKITVSVKIKNISNIGGKEVVQLYIRDVKSTLIKPFKELKDFRKVFVEAGEVENIIFQVSKDQLKSYDTTNKQWVTEAGTYEILVGNCSDNISVSASFIASGYSLYNYNAETMLTTLYDDERARNILECGMQEFGIDPNDLSDCLYYFPHRAIGKVLKRLCNNVDDRSNKEKNDWCKGILDRLHKLDLSLI
jgi:beta-glucosidase